MKVLKIFTQKSTSVLSTFMAQNKNSDAKVEALSYEIPFIYKNNAEKLQKKRDQRPTKFSQAFQEHGINECFVRETNEPRALLHVLAVSFHGQFTCFHMISSTQSGLFFS